MRQNSGSESRYTSSGGEIAVASTSWDPLLHGDDSNSGGEDEFLEGQREAMDGSSASVRAPDGTACALTTGSSGATDGSWEPSTSCACGQSGLSDPLPVSGLTNQLCQSSLGEGLVSVGLRKTASGDGTSCNNTQEIATSKAWQAAGVAKEGLLNLPSAAGRVCNPVCASAWEDEAQQSRISFAELAKSHDLAKAAKMELHFGTSPDGRPNMFPEGEDGTSVLLAHGLEVRRQFSVMHSVREDAATESTVLREMLSLVVDRLTRSKSSCSLYARLFADMAFAESKYSKQMKNLSGEDPRHALASTDTSPVGDAQAATALQLPLFVARAHAQTADSLARDAELLKNMEQVFLHAWKTMSEDSSRLAHASKAALQHLRHAFVSHEAACRSVDTLVRANGGSGKAIQLESDPWVTESLLAKAHKHLRSCLEDERRCMDVAFQKFQQLELKRSTLLSRILRGYPSYYETSACTVHDLAVEMAGATQATDMEPDLDQLMLAANQAMESSNELAVRQRESVDSVATELFCSPEILRQGAMELWDGVRVEWAEYHFVLTRSGFLHWFLSTDNILPHDGMNLQRSSIEAGEPPIFSVMEDGHGSWFAAKRPRKVTFKAQDVEDCCEWVIAIREQIATKLG